jgi:hypothetical protein
VGDCPKAKTLVVVLEGACDAMVAVPLALFARMFTALLMLRAAPKKQGMLSLNALVLCALEFLC